MNIEEKKKLIYDYEKIYQDKLIKNGLEDRLRMNVLLGDVFGNILEDISKPKELFNLTDIPNSRKFSVFKAKPNSGKSTMTNLVFIPTVTGVLYPCNIFPVHIIVNPDSIMLKQQVSDALQVMTNTEPIISMDLISKKLTIERIRTIRKNKTYFAGTQGVVLNMSHGLINAGKQKKRCKEETLELVKVTIENIHSQFPDHKILVHVISDECRISSASNELNKKFKEKSTFVNDKSDLISFMPAFVELVNSTMTHSSVINTLVTGLDGTPTYNMRQKVPMKKGNVLPGLSQSQDDNYSKMIEYGGGEELWEEQSLSKHVPKSEDTLHESYYDGMMTKDLQNFTKLVDNADKYVTDLNSFNREKSKKLDLLLKPYDAKIDTRIRSIIIISGSDDDRMGSRYIKSEQVTKYMIEKNIDHALCTDDKYYIFEDGKMKNDLELHEVEDIIDDEDKGIKIVVLKRKRLVGWNHPPICGSVGLSEHTDLMSKFPTAKNFESNAQANTRPARIFTGLCDLNDKPLSPKDVAKLAVKLKLNNKHNLSKEIEEVLLKNNKFKVWYITGDSDVHGQLDIWLNKNYSDSKLFKQMFEEEKQKNSEIHPLECTCITCPQHGKDILENSEISENFNEEILNIKLEELV